MHVKYSHTLQWKYTTIYLCANTGFEQFEQTVKYSHAKATKLFNYRSVPLKFNSKDFWHEDFKHSLHNQFNAFRSIVRYLFNLPFPQPLWHERSRGVGLEIDLRSGIRTLHITIGGSPLVWHSPWQRQKTSPPPQEPQQTHARIRCWIRVLSNSGCIHLSSGSSLTS